MALRMGRYHGPESIHFANEKVRAIHGQITKRQNQAGYVGAEHKSGKDALLVSQLRRLYSEKTQRSVHGVDLACSRMRLAIVSVLRRVDPSTRSVYTAFRA